ncbi:F-box domain protein [Cooperia oncophora]
MWNAASMIFLNHFSRLEGLPNEILLKIVAYCDFTSKMNMRAVNHRFCALVEKSAHAVRHNLIGGVEIRRGDGDVEDTFDRGVGFIDDFYAVPCASPRTSSKESFRHVCVCHSLKLCGVPLDEGLASDILDASFRAVSDVIIDKVHTVTAETLVKLIGKVRNLSKSFWVPISEKFGKLRFAVNLADPCCSAFEPSTTSAHLTSPQSKS